MSTILGYLSIAVSLVFYLWAGLGVWERGWHKIMTTSGINSWIDLAFIAALFCIATVLLFAGTASLLHDRE
jgi:TRAP-type C4-dicarboxylate transport system permease small subunit